MLEINIQNIVWEGKRSEFGKRINNLETALGLRAVTINIIEWLIDHKDGGKQV